MHPQTSTDVCPFAAYAAARAEFNEDANPFEPWEEWRPSAAKHHFTFFFGFGADRYTTEDLTLIELQERIQNASARKKGDLPWLKMAKFGNKRSDKNSYRHDANVLEITGIELDYD